jgi:hypothetical protein
MKALMLFEANDGSRWEAAADAVKRDALIEEVDAIAALLYPRKSSFQGYIQHDADVYNEVKRRLVAVAAREVGGPWFAEGWGNIHPRGVVGRVIGEVDGPVWWLWRRLMCTDDSLREWETESLATHPDKGEQVRINPVVHLGVVGMSCDGGAA